MGVASENASQNSLSIPASQKIVGREFRVMQKSSRPWGKLALSGFLPDARPRQRARRSSALTALAYNLRRALNILGVEAMTAAVAA
jgi:hypothetical protein